MRGAILAAMYKKLVFQVLEYRSPIKTQDPSQDLKNDLVNNYLTINLKHTMRGDSICNSENILIPKKSQVISVL